MDKRLFLTGLLGVIGTAGIATVLPRRAEALTAVPNIGEPLEDVDEGFELAHMGRHHRWRRVCRRYWHHGHWHRRCHRQGFWIWLWI